jgi:hypothetical protein
MPHIFDFKTVLAKKVYMSYHSSFRRIFVSIFRLTRKNGVIQPNQELSPDPYFLTPIFTLFKVHITAPPT